MKFKISAVSAAVAVAALGVGAIASASVENQIQVHSKSVSYDAAAVQTAAGARAFYGRLRALAADVCSDGMAPHGERRWAQQQCAADAVDKAVADVNAAPLRALHYRDL